MQGVQKPVPKRGIFVKTQQSEKKRQPGGGARQQQAQKTTMLAGGHGKPSRRRPYAAANWLLSAESICILSLRPTSSQL